MSGRRDINLRLARVRGAYAALETARLTAASPTEIAAAKRKLDQETELLNRAVGERAPATLSSERPGSSRRSPEWDWHCAEFAAAHVKGVTGRDPWQAVGGCPRSAREAGEVMRKLKARTFRGAVSKLLGRPIDPKLAMRGDIAMVVSECGRFRALGIVRGDLVECLDRMQPIGRAECAWKIVPR